MYALPGAAAHHLAPDRARAGHGRLLVFIGAWNEFLFALTFTTKVNTVTVPVAIFNFSGSTRSPGERSRPDGIGDAAHHRAGADLPASHRPGLDGRSIEGLTAGGGHMHLGIFSNVVNGDSPEEVAAKTRGYGLQAVQFIPAASGIGFGFDKPALGDDFPRWASAYRNEGVEIAGVGGYMNLLHPDPQKRAATIETFKDFLRRMRPELGTRLISTETGTYATSSDWDAGPAQPHRRRLGRPASGERGPGAGGRAGGRGDPVRAVHLNVAYSPDLARVCMVREIDSPHLRLLMDPTNWFEVASLDAVRAAIEHGFGIERELFLLAHAKDVTHPTTDPRQPGVLQATGQGLLDFATYIRLLREHGYDGALVMEHLTEEGMPATVSYVERYLGSAATPSNGRPDRVVMVAIEGSRSRGLRWRHGRASSRTPQSA